MRPLPLGIAVSILVAASGCGTTFNTLGPGQYPHAYGGVEIDCKAMQATWSNPPGAELPLSEKLLLTSLIAIDFPLCVAGDTITLPMVILQSGISNSAWDRPKKEPGTSISTIYSTTGFHPANELRLDASPQALSKEQKSNESNAVAR